MTPKLQHLIHRKKHYQKLIENLDRSINEEIWRTWCSNTRTPAPDPLGRMKTLHPDYKKGTP